MVETRTLTRTEQWKSLREQERENLVNLRNRLVEKHTVSKWFPSARGTDVTSSATKPLRVGTKELLKPTKAFDRIIWPNSETPDDHSAKMPCGQLEGPSSPFITLKYPSPRELTSADVAEALSRLSVKGFLPQ